MASEGDPIQTIAGFQAFREADLHWHTPLGQFWKFKERIHNGTSALYAHYTYEGGVAPHTRDVVLRIGYQPLHRERRNGYPEDYSGARQEGEFLEVISGLYFRPDNFFGKHGPIRIGQPRRPKNILRLYNKQVVGPKPPKPGERRKAESKQKLEPESVPEPEPESEPRRSVNFLEYCPGVTWEGKRWYNLEVFDRQDIEPIAEIDIWGIFKQFTRMLMMLDNGNEIPIDEGTSGDRQLPFWEKSEICHYNIEPRNILIGYREAEGDRLPTLKVPTHYMQAEIGRYRFPNQDNGREGYRAPEALLAETEMVNPFRHGTCSNIFQFANILRVLMLRDQSVSTHLLPTDEDFILGLGEYSEKHPLSYAAPLRKTKDKVVRNQYSAALKDVIIECMRESPSQRPLPKTLWCIVREGYENCKANFKGPHDPQRPSRTWPKVHPIFANTSVARPHSRTPVPSWLTPYPEWKDEIPPPSPRQLSPEMRGRDSDGQYYVDDPYLGDDIHHLLPDDFPRSRPQVPRRHPHGYPILEERPSVNIPEHLRDTPGSITRNLQLMRYYERLGDMWMGEENYWKMLEAGLDPQTYNWGMRIPDPERVLDKDPLSGNEYDEGDSEDEEGRGDEGGGDDKA
ncbi:hypothetical protein NHQ30_001920 [Ciborinia camelliae]|nr:hypothetical protein NHQ30_001920 [Ciborinia camelliae]